MRNNLHAEPSFGSFLDTLYTISHSDGTISMYQSGLRQFQKFAFEKYQVEVTKMVSFIRDGNLGAYKILQEFVIYLDKAGKKPGSIRSWVSAVKGYLRHEGIKIYTEDFKHNVRLPKAMRHREEPLTREIIVRLLHSVPMKLQTIILVAVASGMRIGEIVQLRISDIDFSTHPTTIRIRAETTKTREARETYLTSEATRMLKDYIIRFFGWNENGQNEGISGKVMFGRTVWRNPNTGEKLRGSPTRRAISNLAISLRNYTSKIPELARLNENGRSVIHFHAFRTFFRTAVGNAVGRDYAEAIIGHRFYLDSYYNLPKEKRREMYLKAESHITITDFKKVEMDMASVRERQEEIIEKQLELKRILKGKCIEFPDILEKLTT